MKLDLKEWIAKITDHFCCDLLYSGSFSSGTITLSKSVANYKRLIVVYSDNDGSKFTKEVIHDKAATFPFVCESIRPTGVLYVKAMIVNASGASMTMAFNRQSAGGGTPASGTYITISKIYGCTSIVGGVLRSSIFKAFSDFTSHLFGGDVDETETERNAGSADKADNIHSSRFFIGNHEHFSWEQYDLYSTSANIAYANSYLRILLHKLGGSFGDIQLGLLDRIFYCKCDDPQLKFISSKQCNTDTVFSLRSLAISERGWAV